MFKNSYQNGLLSIFYSCGANPLAIWDTEVKNGHIKRLTDKEVNSIVLEIVSTNVATTYITCPKNKQVLGIKLPFLVMIIKNLKRYFSFEITILDDKNMRRRFRISNFQSTTKIKPFCTSMPIGLAGGWNQIQFNLADFTRRAYGTQFIETLRVQVHANARIRRIYFSERLFSEDELPQDYKLYLPLERKQKKAKVEKKGEPAVQTRAGGASTEGAPSGGAPVGGGPAGGAPAAIIVDTESPKKGSPTGTPASIPVEVKTEEMPEAPKAKDAETPASETLALEPESVPDLEFENGPVAEAVTPAEGDTETPAEAETPAEGDFPLAEEVKTEPVDEAPTEAEAEG